MKKKIKLGYQWFYDTDLKDKKFLLDIIQSSQLQKNKREATKALKLAYPAMDEYTMRSKEAAMYEVILIKKRSIKNEVN